VGQGCLIAPNIYGRQFAVVEASPKRLDNGSIKSRFSWSCSCAACLCAHRHTHTKEHHANPWTQRRQKHGPKIPLIIHPVAGALDPPCSTCHQPWRSRKRSRLFHVHSPQLSVVCGICVGVCWRVCVHVALSFFRRAISPKLCQQGVACHRTTCIASHSCTLKVKK
jgi:hypothetical protein